MNATSALNISINNHLLCFVRDMFVCHNIKTHTQAVQLRPAEARSHMNLGAMYHLLGQTAAAVASYREALRLQPGDRTTLANLMKLGVGASEVA